jgi:2-oxoglutarate dehydrogenase complex dehydrogenase (E1) component-like enzyme
MTSLPITGVYNDGYVAELFEQYRRDPDSVDEAWRQYFRFAESLAGSPGGIPAAASPASAAPDVATLRRVAGAAALMDAIRIYGHFAVVTDPLGTHPTGAAELQPSFHGIVEEDLAKVPAQALGFESGTAGSEDSTSRTSDSSSSTWKTRPSDSGSARSSKMKAFAGSFRPTSNARCFGASRKWTPSSASFTGST